MVIDRDGRRSKRRRGGRFAFAVKSLTIFGINHLLNVLRHLGVVMEILSTFNVLDHFPENEST
jgi:hypothetical protein